MTELSLSLSPPLSLSLTVPICQWSTFSKSQNSLQSVSESCRVCWTGREDRLTDGSTWPSVTLAVVLLVQEAKRRAHEWNILDYKKLLCISDYSGLVLTLLIKISEALNQVRWDRNHWQKSLSGYKHQTPVCVFACAVVCHSLSWRVCRLVGLWDAWS